MITLTLILCFISALSSRSMLSMLLFLVSAYIASALWLIQHKLIYSGIIYVLVYVGAIVVLFIFVIQLTSTTLNASDTNTRSNSYWASFMIMLLLSYLTVTLTTEFSNELLLYISNFNMSDNVLVDHESPLISSLNLNLNATNLKLVSQELFSEYAYVLIITIHAIVLSIIGAIPLALVKPHHAS